MVLTLISRCFHYYFTIIRTSICIFCLLNILRDITIYRRVDHTIVIKKALIRAAKTSRPNTQPPYDQPEAAKLCEMTRNEHKVTYLRLQLTHKHERGVDEQKTHTGTQKRFSHPHRVKYPHQG